MSIRGKQYADGGLINNFAISDSIKSGATTIIVLAPTVREETNIINAKDSFNLLTSLPEYCYLDKDISFIEKINKIQEPFPHLRNIDHILIRPSTPSGIGLLDFDYPDKHLYIEEGYNLAMDVLNKEYKC